MKVNKKVIGATECEEDNIKFKDIENKLVIITTNIKNFKAQEFSTFETPDFEVAQAIKISSSMPGLMAPYEYENVPSDYFNSTKILNKLNKHI